MIDLRFLGPLTKEQRAEIRKLLDEKKMKKTISDLVDNEPPTPKVDVEGWIRWEGAAHSPVPPRTVVETVGLNGDYSGPAGMIVNWQKIKKYRVLSAPDAPKYIAEHHFKDYGTMHHFTLNETPKANDIQEGGTHYKDMKIQVWDVIDTWPIEQQIGFHRGNALKYLMRMGSKDERPQELKKARHYISKLIEVLEK